MTDSTPVLEHAVSPDGTPIGYRRSGRGPALLLVHGTTADASRWETVRPLLDPHVTVHAMDRRGRGASGDAPGYSLAAEAADVATVVDAIAAATGRPVDVLAHSYGALCALEATASTTAVRRLVLYDPPIGSVTPPGFADRVDALVEQGRPEDAVRTVFALIGMSPEQVGLAESQPSWTGRVAAAHTIGRETREEEAYRFDPLRFATFTVPTLLLAGDDSPPDLLASTATLAAALPGAQVVRMAGQGHVAMLTAPELFVARVLAFLQDP
ncbi:alpha/beta hydrolase [Pseudonocardia sp.]|uniref:alpha/beta fold hydrolase n=1 Tax=Pseudonocardia sp. TaxID=60912 RepID=UPI00261A2591|nr:alpha/beta hydrolase [Pseudonocardia sp.]